MTKVQIWVLDKAPRKDQKLLERILRRNHLPKGSTRIHRANGETGFVFNKCLTQRDQDKIMNQLSEALTKEALR